MDDDFEIPDEVATHAVAVVVDRSTFSAHVFRNGEHARWYPVGLGRDGSTPLGEFRVARKLTDPDWYNAGESVPAGDPRNPLGRRWMGLAREGTHTSYGIHPTSEADSIGREQSRG